eukprot:TRINITY_DN51921_c0_g1_i1.p1 TRINITY_DN51921_c0_g1~~TRINITY_DN51921_c0_g1_i1.p1  ORF type:complete len:470 (-),score=75.07 TRINITY_DN51921_c0_g1_i1:77-1486(-)
MAKVFKRSFEELEAALSDTPRHPQDVATMLEKLADADEGSFISNVTLALAAVEMGSTVEEDMSRLAMKEQGPETERELQGFRHEIGDTAALFAAIKRWALEGLREGGAGSFPQTVPLWPSDLGPQQVTYTAAQCRNLLANALLMNVHDTTADLKPSRFRGGLNFRTLMRSRAQEGAQRLACLFQFFDRWRQLQGTPEELRKITFERRCSSFADLGEFKQWIQTCGTKKGEGLRYELHEDGMEAIEDADAFVNFANPNFGYGHFIASCTQEEILQVCCPEFNVGMLHVGVMADREVVVVHGARRHSAYYGYARTFEYAGPWSLGGGIQSILTIDAVTEQHFGEAAILRDVQKAYLAFSGCKHVSSGRWGCGVFGGTPAHKLVQQVLAAMLAGASLSHSTFGDVDDCDVVLDAILSSKPTASQLLGALLLASSAYRARSFKSFPDAFVELIQHGAQKAVDESCSGTTTESV